MNKFHQIPTDKFIPVSHDNSYLFNHYNKVANFLAFNLDRNFKTILAKPVQNGYIIDWFSVHSDLKDIKEFDKESSEKALSEYWEFIGLINSKIDQLRGSSDENNRNWAGLLKKVFNHQDNFIFFNGSNVCIVWGWKFENFGNYKPSFAKEQKEIETFHNQTSEISKEQGREEVEDSSAPPPEPVENNFKEEELQVEEQEQVLEEEPADEDVYLKRPGFYEFLKWFASRYWWSLGILVLLITTVLLVRSINTASYYSEITTDLDQIDSGINNSAN